VATGGRQREPMQQKQDIVTWLTMAARSEVTAFLKRWVILFVVYEINRVFDN
jgi:hypothetical protein